MDFGNAGWLQNLLTEEVARHRPEPAVELIEEVTSQLTGRARARLYLRRVLRESGLLYGTPTGANPAPSGTAPEERLFLAVMRTLVRMALDIAGFVEAPAGPRREQLLALFAALTDQGSEAEEILQRVATGREGTVSRRSWSRVEDALEGRAMSLAGDPAYGLVLHNGAVYADANVFGQHAIQYLSRGRLDPVSVRRRNRVAAHQKALLVEVLTALTRVERPPSFPVRRAILRQIEDLKLPSDLEDQLRAKVKRTFDHPPRLVEVVREVRSAEMRRFILEQTLLASLVDGRRSPSELRFIQALAAALEVSPQQLSHYELVVAEFYAKNRSVVDVFTVAAGADLLGQEALEQMQSAVEKNVQRLLTEVRETGELSVLLAKAARGQKLSDQDRKKMRAQLIDIAKAIPALAIFAAPGGLFLLIALAKVLPFNLLPSAFQDPPPEQEP